MRKGAEISGETCEKFVTRGFNPLHYVAHAGNARLLRLFLEKGVRSLRLSPVTPLHLAVANGKIDCVMILLDHHEISSKLLDPPIEVYQNFNDSQPSSEDAMRIEDQRITDTMYPVGPIQNSLESTERKKSFLEAKISPKDLEWAWYLTSTITTSNPDVSGTALHLSICFNRKDIAALLIHRGANLEAIDGVGRTALHSAVQLSLAPVLENLLDAGAKINSRDRNGGTPLMLANVEMLTVLLHRGADLSSTDHLGRSALYYAASRGDLDIVLQLLGLGLRWDQQDHRGCSPLCCSLTSHSTAMRSFALDFSKDYSTNCSIYGPSLFQLCVHRLWDTMSEMLEKGKSREIRNVIDQSSNNFPPALYCAALIGEPEPLRLLVQAGADLEVSWGEYGRPLGVACAMGRLDTVKFLIEKGAKPSWIGSDGNVVTVFEMAAQHENVLTWLRSRKDPILAGLEKLSSQISKDSMPSQGYQYQNHLKEEQDSVRRLESLDRSRINRRSSFFSDSILHSSRNEVCFDSSKSQPLTKESKVRFVSNLNTNNWSEILDNYKDIAIERATSLTPPKRNVTFPLAPFILRCRPDSPWVIS